MIVNGLNLTFLTRRGAFLCWNGCVLDSVMELGSIGGVMGRDCSGRGVHIRVKRRYSDGRLAASVWESGVAVNPMVWKVRFSGSRL